DQHACETQQRRLCPAHVSAPLPASSVPASLGIQSPWLKSAACTFKTTNRTPRPGFVRQPRRRLTSRGDIAAAASSCPDDSAQRVLSRRSLLDDLSSVTPAAAPVAFWIVAPCQPRAALRKICRRISNSG